MNKWRDLTDLEVNQGTPLNRALLLLTGADSLDMLAEYCSEFLVHAADVEGLCRGIDRDLVQSMYSDGHVGLG
jgi:phosphoribosylformimino-5-aminoimidazole carboxamide ribotide isomerase